MEVVLVVRVLAAVAIVVSVCCGTTALIDDGRVPRCLYAALPAFTRPIVRKRRGVRECASRVTVYARKCVYANAGCVYARGVFTHQGAYTRVSAFTRAGGAYTYLPVYTHPGVYTRVGAYTRALGAFTQRVRTRTRVRIRG